jgi:predicted NUDIX family NTP pyrophosphohydrolase
VQPVSAGILLYRRTGLPVEVLLIHPGGPFWRGKDAGAWMIPKGGLQAGEESLAAALREFEEELGTPVAGVPRPLCRIRQKGGKWVEAFALEGDLDITGIVSNMFRLEYPPKSGQFRDFPEVDEARWFALADAYDHILPSQRPILDALAADLDIKEEG